MVNARQMGRYFRKRASNWLYNKNAKDFIAAYRELLKIQSTDILVVNYLNNGDTWFYEDIPLEFPGCLSSFFPYDAILKIKELLIQGDASIGSNNQNAFILQAFKMF